MDMEVEERNPTNEGTENLRDKEQVPDETRFSYAQIVQNVSTTESHETATKKETSQDRKKRLFTIYNLASTNPSESDIASGVEIALKQKPREVLQKIQRDTRFRARYNILFKTEQDCNYIKTNGFTVAGQKIGGKNFNYKRKLPVTNIFIPNFPATGTEEELTKILSETNSVTYVRERFSNELGFAIGGWKAGLIRELGKPIPDTITYENEVFDVIYPGKVRQERPRDRNWERESMSSTSFIPKKKETSSNKTTSTYANKVSSINSTNNKTSTHEVASNDATAQSSSHQLTTTKESTSKQKVKNVTKEQSKVKKLKEKFSPTKKTSEVDFSQKDELNQKEMELYIDQINYGTIEDVAKDLEMSDDSSYATVHEAESVASHSMSDSKMSSNSSRKRKDIAGNENETEEDLVKTKKERTSQWASDQSGGKET